MAGSSIVSKLYDDDVLYEMICSAKKSEIKQYNHLKSHVKNNIRSNYLLISRKYLNFQLLKKRLGLEKCAYHQSSILV